MITTESRPSPTERLHLFDIARDLLTKGGYLPLGIDQFALPIDNLAIMAAKGQMRRNFQGYTDDQAQVLIGLGPLSISRFPQEFAQIAARTADCTAAVRSGHFATHRGHRFSADDHLRALMIEELMCDFRITRAKIAKKLRYVPPSFNALLESTAKTFGQMVRLDAAGLTILPKGYPLARLIAQSFDAYDPSKAQYSAAI